MTFENDKEVTEACASFSTLDALLGGVIHSPKPGKKASELTDGERLCVAICAGAECEATIDGVKINITTKRVIGIVDDHRNPGGYIVYIGHPAVGTRVGVKT